MILQFRLQLWVAMLQHKVKNPCAVLLPHGGVALPFFGGFQVLVDVHFVVDVADNNLVLCIITRIDSIERRGA